MGLLLRISDLPQSGMCVVGGLDAGGHSAPRPGAAAYPCSCPCPCPPDQELQAAHLVVPNGKPRKLHLVQTILQAMYVVAR